MYTECDVHMSKEMEEVVGDVFGRRYFSIVAEKEMDLVRGREEDKNRLRERTRSKLVWGVRVEK